MSEPVPPSRDAQEASARQPAPWPHWTSDLHESLASQEASAAELRQDLDELRRTLDAPPARTPASAARSFRSRRMVAAAVGVVLVLALAAGLAVWSGRRGEPPAAGATTTSGVTPTASLPTTPATTATGPTTRRPTPAALAAPLPDWPGRTGPEPPGLPARGVGADAAGTELTAALAADRSVEVYERAVLAQGARTLSLSPARSPALTRSLDAPPPGVEGMHAEIDGRPVPVARTTSGWTLAAPSGTTARRLALRYRLSGALVRLEPAPPGRYTLVLTPLAPSAGDGAGNGVVVRIQDPRIQELYCPGATNQLCGRVDGALHTATVPAGAVPVVVALVTFPS